MLWMRAARVGHPFLKAERIVCSHSLHNTYWTIYNESRFLLVQGAKCRRTAIA